MCRCRRSIAAPLDIAQGVATHNRCGEGQSLIYRHVPLTEQTTLREWLVKEQLKGCAALPLYQPLCAVKEHQLRRILLHPEVLKLNRYR